jgi:lambda family phage tail tape measure protein
MTQDIASLGIKVETGDVAKASTELDGLTQAGAKAQKATESLSTESKKAGASIKAMAAETKAAEAAAAKLEKQTNATGLSAKQTAAALRGVPAQVTDIVTSLQGGQAPLTVLLQQGGQLKDMFGGIVPAARALGGYVAGLINPFTLAAAAAAALGLAYFKGSEEATAYNKALILTGNAAGTSGDQLASLAEQVSSTVGTTGAAAEVLAKLAGNGKIAGESFGEIATAAIEMEKATGKAIDETIAEFAKIAKDPVAAAKELNDQYNFLTASVYSQIVALKEQGDTIGAAKLLTDAYADTIKTRTADVTANLGLIESAWKKVKSAAAGALDATLDVGRTQSIDAQIAEREKLLASRKDGFLANLFPDTLGANSESTKFIEGQVDALKRAKVQIEANAKAEGDRVKVQKEGIDASIKLKAISDANLTNEEKRNKLIKEYKREVEALRKADPNSPLVQADVVAKNIQNIKDKNKDPAAKPGRVNLTDVNDAQNAIKAIQSAYSNSEKELEAQQKAGLISQQSYLDQRTALIRAEREEVTGAYQSQISALETLKDKSSTTGEQRIQLDQKIADARASMVKAQKDADSQLNILSINEQGLVKAQTAASEAYVAQLERQRAALETSGTRAANSLGLGDRQQGLQNSLDGATDKFNEERAKLLDRRRTAPDKYSMDAYQKDLASLQTAEDRYRETVIGNYDKMSAAQSNWQAGATSAFANYLESSRDVAGQTKSLFTNAFSSMEDAIVQFAMTGKLSFSDFAKSVLADMAKIAVRQASSSALSGLFGIVANVASSYFTGGSGNGLATGSAGATSSNLGASQAGYSAPYFQAKGGAWLGGVQMFANGGAFSNSVVTQPTAFAMGNGGLGVAGEAGPEAIVPLARDSQGRLGVRGGAGNSSTINVSVTVDATDGGGATPNPARLAEAIKVVCRQEIANSRRNGGQLA